MDLIECMASAPEWTMWRTFDAAGLPGPKLGRWVGAYSHGHSTRRRMGGRTGQRRRGGGYQRQQQHGQALQRAGCHSQTNGQQFLTE